MSKAPHIKRFVRSGALLLLLASVGAGFASAAEGPNDLIGGFGGAGEPAAHQTREWNGVLTTQENATLRLNIDLGSVRVLQLERGASPAVRYVAHVETDARGSLGQQLLERYALVVKGFSSGVEITGNLPQPAAAAKGSNPAQFWVHFDVWVPSGFSLEISTGAGDIQTPDIGGTANLQTEGGNIVSGGIGGNLARAEGKSGATRFAGRLQTQGGHIQVQDVAGDLTAFTAGGHINTGYILGEANLHSGGGHIRAAGIGGKAELATEGGNITVGKAAKFVAVKTGGGQIDFGEVRGSVHAQTGGGGIRRMYVSGPMDVESSGGSICLTRVSGSVRAATGSGSITAWINPDNPEKRRDSVSLAGASQLTSDDGDIVVFLPRNLAANIEAIVEQGGAQRIEADPALSLQVAKASQRSGSVKAVAALNGGGAVLKLKTSAGKIKLQFLDSEMALWESMMREQSARMQRELARTMPAALAYPMAMPVETPWPTPAAPAVNTPPVWALAPMTPMPAVPEAPSVWPGTLLDRIEVRILGGVREDGDDFWKRITRHPNPNYPEIARKSGIEGVVRLQVRLTSDGKIEVQKLLEGDTVLADSAMAAVKQWRGKPVLMDGKPVDVISTLTFDFKLRDQN